MDGNGYLSQIAIIPNSLFKSESRPSWVYGWVLKINLKRTSEHNSIELFEYEELTRTGKDLK